MFHSLDHAVIAVRDLEVATETYTRLLGRRPSWRGWHPQRGTANTLFRLENTYLELLSPESHGAVAADLARRLDHSGEGLLALAFGTNDAAACAAALREHGIAARDPVDGEGRESTSGAVRGWSTVHWPETATRGVMLFAIEHRSPAETLPLAEPQASTPDVVAGMDHVVIMTADASAACTLYRDRLGLRLALDRTFESRGLRLLFFRVGGITVECAARLGAARLDAARLDAPRLDVTPDAPDRLLGISYRVSDLPAAHDRVVKAGFDVSAVRQGQRPGTLVCTVRRETHGVATLFIGPAGVAQGQPS